MFRDLPRPACLALLLLISPLAVAGTDRQHTSAAAPGATGVAARQTAGPLSADAVKAARAFAAAERQGPLALYAFLQQMPKGADLHVHLSGAIYAETWLSEAADDGMCVDAAALAFVHHEEGPCKPGEVAAADVRKDEHLYEQLVDAFSMRTFVPVTGESGHDHFFATFERYGGVNKRHMGDWLDEVASRAAAQNEQYMELMETPNFNAAAALAEKIGYEGDLVKYRDDLLKAGLRESLPPIRAALDKAEQDRRTREHCDTAAALPACKVELRYLFQILRGFSPERDFAQLVLAFEVASSDPRYVGLNLVRAEDWVAPLSAYRRDMAMVGALHTLYPKVHISLHAGELAPGLVPPGDLTFHIREAVEEAHAERIGHGVDVMYEDRPYALLQEMAAKHVLVEVNLTSNDVILNVKGDEHPLPFYLAAHVPVALSTDDEGVSRITLTHEYVRAASTYHLGYAQLKQMARASLEHSFLPGTSLWRQTTPEVLGEPVTACRAQTGAEKPTGACAELVQSSEKAQQQWELERRFHTFEASFQ